MSQYNPVERKVASLLDRFPGAKKRVKSTYQRFNYYLHADWGFSCRTAEDVSVRRMGSADSISGDDREQFVGYYDITPWSSSMDHFVCHEVADSELEIVSYQGGSRRILGSTSAWNYQQGARAQWLPGRERVIFNDERSGNPFARIVALDGEAVDRFERPVQAVNPRGGEFISLNYRRLDRNRPDYGYDLPSDESLPNPSADGVWVVDMESNSVELVVSLGELISETNAAIQSENHYVNHVLYNPTGDRFVFLHRWRDKDGRISRLYVRDSDGETTLLMDDGIVSHYCWLSETTILVWGRTEADGDGYHMVNVENGETTYVDSLADYGDGHPSVSPSGRYVVTDTYPNRERQRTLLLYDRKTEKVSELGRFLEPVRYTGQRRCDLHPRWSPDGQLISIDSTHSGARNTYVVNVSAIVG